MRDCTYISGAWLLVYQTVTVKQLPPFFSSRHNAPIFYYIIFDCSGNCQTAPTPIPTQLWTQSPKPTLSQLVSAQFFPRLSRFFSSFVSVWCVCIRVWVERIQEVFPIPWDRGNRAAHKSASDKSLLSDWGGGTESFRQTVTLPPPRHTSPG